MATRSVATVFGGSGFIGRYVTKRLLDQGHIVRIAGRNTEAARDAMVAGRVGQVVPLYVSLGNEASIARATEGADIVVNLVGILAEPKAGDFMRIQGEGPGRIARAAAAHNVSRMVHVSAIGASAGSASLYAQSKAAGEQAVLAAMPGATILRPSLVFGAEDQFFNRFGALAMTLPVMPVISGGTRFQPVFVGDVADAVMAVLARDDTKGQTFELGGPRVWTFREILAWILKETRRNRPMLNVPMGIARLQARIGELIPGKPLTRDQLILLGTDNVVGADMPGLQDLGIVPSSIELVVPAYLARYRPGGGRREEAPVA